MSNLSPATAPSIRCAGDTLFELYRGFAQHAHRTINLGMDLCACRVPKIREGSKKLAYIFKQASIQISILGPEATQSFWVENRRLSQA